MISLEWFSSFAAIYRAGSVSAAARQRLVTQSALSQQLSGLEALIGFPLFERTSKGMIPTPRGKALYNEIFEAVDCLDRVAHGLLRAQSPNRSVRFGTSPEYFHGFALEQLGNLGIDLTVTLGKDGELLEGLITGGLDVIAVMRDPGSRTLESQILRDEPYALIGKKGSETPREGTSLTELATWLNTMPWVSYSEERPVTRKFWQQALGARFAAKPALVVPDILTVVAAVEMGIGLSIVPKYLCQKSMDEQRVQEIWPIGALIPPERRYVCVRRTDIDRQDLVALRAAIAADKGAKSA